MAVVGLPLLGTSPYPFPRPLGKSWTASREKEKELLHCCFDGGLYDLPRGQTGVHSPMVILSVNIAVKGQWPYSCSRLISCTLKSSR